MLSLISKYSQLSHSTFSFPHSLSLPLSYPHSLQDFETYFTPAFRHPPITGYFDELYEIGLLSELWNLQIFSCKDLEKTEIQNKLEELTKVSKNKNQQQKLREMLDKLKNRKAEQSELNKTLIKDNSILPGLRSLKWDAKKQIVKKYDILTTEEKLNVDVPANRQKFREWYIKVIEEIINQEKNKFQKHEDQQQLNEQQMDSVLLTKLQKYYQDEREKMLEEADPMQVTQAPDK